MDIVLATLLGFIAGFCAAHGLWVVVGVVIMVEAIKHAPEGPDCEWTR
jgi:hypothetical protein